MEFRQIIYFLEIAESGTFQKAASLLGLTQPALSRQIFLLEKELGVTVLERGGRSVRLTHEGERFYQYSVRMKELWEEIQNGFSKEKELKGNYSISAGGTVSAWILPQILKEILKKRQGLSLSVREGDDRETKDALLKGEVDLGILTGPITEPSLNVLEFLSDQIIPCAAKNHPIFLKKKIRIEDLKKQSFVFFHPGSALRKAVEKKIKSFSKEFASKIAMELRSVESVIKSLEAGLGIGFLSEYAMSSKLKKIKFEDWNAERKFYLCYRKKSGPGLAKLAEEILRASEKWRIEKEPFPN
ncbi:LysR family transcriptional regulator [Leptospira sp. 2 VSF19]|uniref:LysR family transcriptional regulator n=1 Tax=Leptospira soteropolitanensis TaxID=2950025 RepID=A0AAW5VHI2_9LEPT|nr:LysR family transcriptional regulator [Leptospira soteropolitanensis]MCW7494415.1 LysR family transcriptional regulator [Leptospira soteropolitanensis]MCW7502010.1 LysR family transcriptional regulator [Leptospira soteropolitanensis]MCW7524261.1 LysR family transcriptional regulator [Leptospira soteropolitanensis]MCW7528126.1 LysR family transcriptional regulator [Leptospira soteropolitanensis]MCW7531980.1 LysR family transcriptional regulator [Leptospira soteropolitanensis]